MDLAWNVYGLGGVAGLVATWAMAAFLWGNATDRSVNRHLAILLVFEGLAVATSGAIFFLVVPADRWAASVVHFMVDATLPPLYALFLAHALDVPFARALRTRAGHAILWALAAAGPVFVFAFDRRFYAAEGVPGPWLAFLLVYVTAGFLFGIVGAIYAYRRARTPTAKARARSFVIAFTFFDLAWGAIYGTAAAYAAGAMRRDVTNEVSFVYALVTPVFVALLAHAILRTQLFDIDLKIKVGIRRGTVALAFLVVFVAVSEVAQAVLSTQFGLAAGGAVAGLMLVALRPLERAADRVAHAAMPRADGSPEYLAYKKLEVYRAAVESALEADGRIDERERGKLVRLAAKLGVRPEDASAVQRDAEVALAPPRAVPSA